jgi:hypothetical protein
MTKKRREQKKPQPPREYSIPKRYAHPLMALLLVLAFTVFFHEAWLQNKVFIAPDNIGSRSFESYRADLIEQGEQPLWVPYIFSGMPGAQALFVSPHRWYDFIREGFNRTAHLYRLIFGDNDVFRIVFYHLMFALALYALIYRRIRDPLISFFAVASLSFCTGIIIWIMAAHNIKTLSFTAFPLLLLFAEMMKEKVKLWHIVVLSATLHISFSAHHFQMLYYAYLGTGLYFLFFIVRSLIRRESVLGYIKSGAAIALCTGIAFLLISDRYLMTLEYNQYSIRRAEPAIETDDAIVREGGGLDYDYATAWSFSPGEVLTFFIPSLYGFGNWTYEGPLTNFEPVTVNTYFGQMPFTEQPLYMGIVLLGLAVIGAAMYRKDPFVQYLMALGGLSLLISFGRTMPILYDPLFHFMPLFNSFRVPSMILILLQTAVAVLAAYGLAGIVKSAREQKTLAAPVWLRRTLAAIGTLFLLSFLARGAFESAYIGMIEASGTPIPPQLYGWVYERMMNDVSVNLGLLAAALGLILLFYKRSIPAIALVGCLVVLSLADLWRISYRPMQYQPAERWEQIFRASDAVQFIQQDESLFRVLRIENNRLASDNTMIHHRIQDVNGYHPAKLRVYQDVIDFVGLHNPAIWNILNVKYLIADRDLDQPPLIPVFRGSRVVHENPNALPRAWFADSVVYRSAPEILRALGSDDFDPRETAYVSVLPVPDVAPPGGTASVTVTDFRSHSITAEVSAAATHFLVISEVYYPAGWRAYINDVQTEIIQTNHFMRGIVVPPGNHVLEMRFHSPMFDRGVRISLIMNIVLIGTGLVLIIMRYVPTGARSVQS